jgi:Na+-transporting methylmalonyl-CoA/oxaloacetate decarboxylase gamma subunit
MVAGFRVLLFLVVLLILIFFVDVVPQAVVKHELPVRKKKESDSTQ